MKYERRELRGDRNQCPTCGKFFNSTSAFEKHRTGTYEEGRRCMTTEEMLAAKMAINKDGWWVGSLMATDVLESRKNSVLE